MSEKNNITIKKVKINNRCDQCGKFKSKDDLILNYTPDTNFTIEELYYICKDCSSKSK